MKKLLLAAFSLGIMFSCSSDDVGGTPDVDNRDYFPTSVDAEWLYDYTASSQGNPSSGQATVNMGLDMNIDNTNYEVLSNTIYIVGAMDEIPFKKSGNEVILRPVFDFQGNNWVLDELDFIRSEMSPNEFLDEATNEVVGAAMPIPADNITGTVTPHTFITFKTQHVGRSVSMAVNGTNFQNILHNRAVLEIKVVLDINAQAVLGGQTIGIVRQHELVPQQQYGTVNLWLAENTGIIKTDYQYSFENVNMNTNINLGGLTLDLQDIAPELANFNSSLNLSGTSELNSFSL